MVSSASAARFAAVAPIVEALLPSGSPVERALLAAELVRFAAVDPAILRTVIDPWRCPEPLLPFLAAAVSVDVWDPSWPIERKRKVVAASPAVHRRKGTVGAIKRSLAAFDVDARIVEWWEDDSRRGTFRVEMIYRDGGPAFDPTTQAQAIQAVRAAKPKSRVFTARSVIQAEAPLAVAVLPRAALVWTVLPYAFDGLIATAPLAVGVAPAALLDFTIAPKAA